MQLSDKRPDVEPMIFTFQENQSNSFGASAPSLLARTLTHTPLAKSFPTLLDFFQYLEETHGNLPSHSTEDCFSYPIWADYLNFRGIIQN